MKSIGKNLLAAALALALGMSFLAPAWGQSVRVPIQPGDATGVTTQGRSAINIPANICTSTNNNCYNTVNREVPIGVSCGRLEIFGQTQPALAWIETTSQCGGQDLTKHGGTPEITLAVDNCPSGFILRNVNGIRWSAIVVAAEQFSNGLDQVPASLAGSVYACYSMH